jgi:hypothetical protein
MYVCCSALEWMWQAVWYHGHFVAAELWVLLSPPFRYKVLDRVIAATPGLLRTSASEQVNILVENISWACYIAYR